MATVNAASVAKAINAANELREAFGEPLLGDKLPDARGHQTETKSCVLAKAFNFNCSIVPNLKDDYWRVYFESDKKKHAEKLAEALGTEAVKEGGDFDDGPRYVVTLPEDVGEIARAFDARSLPDEFMER